MGKTDFDVMLGKYVISVLSNPLRVFDETILNRIA